MEAQQSPSSAIQGARTVVENILASLPLMIAGVRSDEIELQLTATTQFRELLRERNPPIEVVIKSGVVPKFVEFLTREDCPQLQYEAAWVLSNIASGTSDNVRLVIESGAIPILVKLLGSPSDDVRGQAVWALGNITGDFPIFDDGMIDRIQAVIEANVCPRLVDLLMHPSPSVLIPALHTVGNICTGNDLQTQIIINHQLLPRLLNLLTNNHEEEIKKEACWTISNITAGNKDQIQAVIAAEIIGPLVHLLQTAAFDIQKEAAWAISNATDGGTNEQIKYLVGQGCIRPLCDLLLCLDARIVTVCLEGLENILRVGEAEKNIGTAGGLNVYAQLIYEAEGLKKIKNLKSHDNTEINEKAVKILEIYWMEDDDEPLPPGDAAAAAGPSELTNS